MFSKKSPKDIEKQNIESDTEATPNPTTFFELPKPLKDNLSLVLKELEVLKGELTEKETDIRTKTNEIKSKIEKIKSVKHVQVNPRLCDIFEKTAQDYAKFIAHGVQEISSYLSFYEAYLDSTSEQLKKIAQQQPAVALIHVLQQIKFLKRYLKKRKKELTVFFSRFDHAYTAHMQKIREVERTL